MGVYDPVAFREYQDRRLGRRRKPEKRKGRDIVTMDEVMADIKAAGFAMVRRVDKDTLRQRGHRQGVKLKFRGHDSALMVVTIHE